MGGERVLPNAQSRFLSHLACSPGDGVEIFTSASKRVLLARLPFGVANLISNVLPLWVTGRTKSLGALHCQFDEAKTKSHGDEESSCANRLWQLMFRAGYG